MCCTRLLLGSGVSVAREEREEELVLRLLRNHPKSIMVMVILARIRDVDTMRKIRSVGREWASKPEMSV